MPKSDVRKRLADVLNPYYANEFKRHVIETKDGLPSWIGDRHSSAGSSQADAPIKTTGAYAQSNVNEEEENGNEDQEASEGDEHSPSYIPPKMSWTAQEKSLFFQALRSHSRLRPDLIAECIGTKGVAQVCLYLDYLEREKTRIEGRTVRRKKGGKDEAAGDQIEQKDERGGEHGGMEKGDAEVVQEVEATEGLILEESDIEEDVNYAVDPYDLEEAYEMSDEWVDLEEHQARFLLLEELHCGKALQESPGDPNGSATKLLTAGRFVSITELVAMDTLLRQEEDADVHAVPEEVKTRYAGEEEDEDEEKLHPGQRGSSPHTRSFSPSIARVASPANADQPSSSKDPIGGRKEALGEMDDEFGDLDDDELDDELDGDRDNGQEHIEEEHRNDDEEAMELLNNPELTREARRRLQKRLYMRRQRALKKGITSIDVTSVKLQTGRQTKVRLGKGKSRARANASSSRKGGTRSGTTFSSSRSSRVTRSGASIGSAEGEQTEDSNSELEGSPLDSDSDSASNSGEDEDGYYAYGNKGGLTTHTRAKQMLEDYEIDAQVLHEEGIGLFNLSVLAKLISIYTSGYRARHASPSEYPTLTSDKQPLISADLIRLLTACAIEFTTATVGRALALSEQQATLKAKTKVWRQSAVEDALSVSGEAVKLAARMTGFRAISKRRYFANLMGENKDKDQESDLDDDDEQENAREIEQSETQMLHDLNPPYVYLPPAYRIPQADEDVLTDDEYTYQEEIQADEMVDRKDRERALAYEEELWDRV